MFDFDVLKISEANEIEDLRDDGPSLGINTVCLDARVTDIPRGPALTLSPEASVATAIEAMRRRARNAAIIVQNHRPVGVITDGVILTQAGTDLDNLRAITVGSLMTAVVEPLDEADTVGDALRTMCAHRQWHLPIVCGRGLFLGGLDIADISLWLRDRLTMLTVDAVFSGVAGPGL